MEVVTYQPIGVVRSPFTTLEGMPLQTVAAQGVQGSVELEPAYAAGLTDLVDFSHLILLTHLHQMSGYSLEVTPYLDDQPHGLFATRSPGRPNPIGLSGLSGDQVNPVAGSMNRRRCSAGSSNRLV
jgi:tRNA (Thr-GGU) A37 N-methylase